MTENVQEIEFVPFPKIPRWSRHIIITEKIDGTNASIWINEEKTIMKVASRNQWITPEKDNYGFAGWAERNKEILWRLGPGHHFGEWWGNGIQRRYEQKEKIFSLFNTSRFLGDNPPPDCCRIVPVLYSGVLMGDIIEKTMEDLRINGSKAAPGWMKPEGIMIYHSVGRQIYKKTFEHDEKGKGE